MSLRGGFLLEENDVGGWRVAGDQLCLVWPKFFYGRERCFQVDVMGPAKARFTGIGQAPSFVADWAKRQ